MIEWDKAKEKHSNSTSDYIQKMENAVDDFCRRLSKDSREFDSKIFFDLLHEYIVHDDRLLYTNITNYIFDLEKEETFGIMQTNLDKVINYIDGEQFARDYEWNPTDVEQRNPYDRTKRTVLKLWDHMNLARRQYSSFKKTDEDYSRVVNKKMEEAEAKLTKDMNGQLISLVSIFTALSFIVFGGISSLDNIFLGAKDIPVTKLMIVGTIWCFCIMNLVYVFLFFISKMTGLNIKSNQDINANLVQKYPLIWWCNWTLITILMFSCWAYYIKCEDFSTRAYEALQKHSTAYLVFGTIAIIALAFAGMKVIYKLSIKKPEN